MRKLYAKICAVASAGLVLTNQFGPAKADVFNTYSGVDCVSVLPTQADNLNRTNGFISAISRTEVVCPIVKADFNSRARVTVAVAASGGTSCRLESFEILSGTPPIASPVRTFPRETGLDFTIPSSFRGAMQLRCVLERGDFIRNYLAREHS